MIYIKCFEFGNKCVMIVPRRNKYAVRAIGYKSIRYKGYVVTSFDKYNYDICSGTLSECNDIFNLEVGYLCKIYDDEIYTIADLIKSKQEITF